jgi:hypothetical protein
MNQSFPDVSPSKGKFVKSLLQNLKNNKLKISSTSRWRKSFLLHNPFVLLTAIAFVVTSGCKDPDEIGLDALPNGDQLGTVFSDTATIYTSIELEDSLNGDELSAQLLGSYDDAIFGITTASIYTQLNLTGTPTFGTNPVADSIVLILGYSGHYGDTTVQQNATVYKLTEDMHVDSSYYTSKAFSYDPIAIGSKQFTPFPTTKIQLLPDTTYLGAQIRIPLDIQLANDFIAQGGTSVYSSNSNFLAYFKGIYIAADPINTVGQGSLSSFSFFNSYVTVYFHNDTVAKSYNFSLANARVNSFSHNYAGTPVEAQLNAGVSDSIAYIQGASGVKTKLSIPYLKHFIDNGSIVVNKAELKVTAQNSAPALFPVPPSLLLTTAANDGAVIFPIDYYESVGYYGGSYNSTDRTYTFNIARQVQRILDGVNNSTDFNLVAAGGGVVPNGVVIGSSTNTSYKLKLSLYYTKIN